MTTLRATNDPEYRAYKRMLDNLDIVCCYPGCKRRATSPDHQPPLDQHTHLRGSGCCTLRPSCLKHQHSQGGTISRAKRTGRLSGYSW
jgi:hypothetical protein